MINIYFINGKHKEKSFEFKCDSISIGRSPNNDIQVKDKSISRKHIKILRKEGKYFIEDLKSTNGAFVNGTQINPSQEVKVEEGAPISIGKIMFSLEKEHSGDISGILDSIDSSHDFIETDKIVLKNRKKKTRKNIELINNVSKVLMHSSNINEILERILNYVFDYFKTIDRGVIILFDNETGKISEVISRFKKSNDDTIPMYSRAVVNRVIEEGTAIVVSDTDFEDEVDLSESMKLMEIKSVMCVPLVSRSQIRGVIYLDSISKPFKFQKEDLSALTALSGPAAIAIENATLYSNLEKIAEESTNNHNRLKIASIN